MRQLKMIQDWGFNYIYLCQAITRINLADHSYKDVARTPIEDFKSATLSKKSTKPYWVQSNSQLWMCGASDRQNDQNCKESSVDEAYILEPFPNDQFVPDAWMDVLVTVDVCVNETSPTVFCDEEGFDLVPFHIVSAVLEKTNKAVCEDNPTDEIEAKMKALNIHDEISMNDNINLGNESDDSDSSIEEEGPSCQLFYDVVDELDEYDTLDPTIIQLKNWKEIGIPNLFPKLQKKQRRLREAHHEGTTIYARKM